MRLNYIDNIDCLEGLKNIPDGSVDMVLCDLPYGITRCKWDSLIPLPELWEQYNRVVKSDGAIVLFAAEPFTSMLITSNIKNYRQKLTWLKTRPTNVLNAKKQFMNWTEDIVVFYRRLPTFNPIMRTDGQFTGAKVQRMNTARENSVFVKTGEQKDYVHEGNGGLFYPKTVLEFSNVHKPAECYHPTQKPVALCEYLIKTYTNPGDVVLDNCIGSGTTAVACLRTGRSYIGFELDAKYHTIAMQRIAAETAAEEWML